MTPAEHTSPGCRVSVVIPSRDGSRDGLVERLREGLRKQVFQDFETIVVTAVTPQGKAINQGVSRSRGEYIVIMDDDAEPADAQLLERLVATLDSDARIGMAGASIILRPDANAFQRRAAGQFPRLNTPEVSEVTDSDLACHGCCAIPKRIFEEAGGEREDIIRGLDPELRARIRRAGYRVVLAPHARIFHPLPENLATLVKTFIRNGYGSAYAAKFRSEAVYETHEALSSATFVATRALPYRMARFPLRLGRSLATGQWLRFAAYCAYACGYLWGCLSATENAVERQ